MTNTSETAPRGYTGPVTLTPAQRAGRDQLVDHWTQSLIVQARDESDPETCANARLLLSNRGVSWEV